MKNNHTHHHNDPDYHDVRATVLLEASHRLKALAHQVLADLISGVTEAAVELRRMASNARRTNKKVLDRKRQESRDSEAKAKAFGYGD
jgi:hypothetical protein